MEIKTPRDREGSFEPRTMPKYQREFRGFDDKILLMYALGLTTRQIHEHLKEIYAVQVSPELISWVTDEVKELASLPCWRGMAGPPPGAGVSGVVSGRAAGKYQEGNPRRFTAWLRFMNELKNRGVKDISD
jgi:transposase-like protein